MIEGIHILSQEAVLNVNWGLFIAFAFISIGVALLLALFAFPDNSFVPSVLAIILLIGSYMLVQLLAEESGRFKYKATIDDSVSFVEVVEKYDFVGREGDIYILEEREIDND